MATSNSKPVVIGGKKVGRVITSRKTGKRMLVLNPSGKVEKAVRELKRGYHETNDRRPKTDKNGKKIPLTTAEKMWRAGYISHASDSAKMYNRTKKYKGGKR